MEAHLALYISAALVSFIFIFSKSFQQLSVTFKKFKWVPAFSYIMAFAEVFIISSVIKVSGGALISSAVLATSLGTGAWLGCMSAMYLHPKLTGKGW